MFGWSFGLIALRFKKNQPRSLFGNLKSVVLQDSSSDDYSGSLDVDFSKKKTHFSMFCMFLYALSSSLLLIRIMHEGLARMALGSKNVFIKYVNVFRIILHSNAFANPIEV